MGRNFIIGDTHGAWLALEELLDEVAFVPGTDHLTVLGDTCDGWPEPHRLMDFYLGLPPESLTYLVGNHDQVFIEWVDGGHHVLLGAGGSMTVQVYEKEDLELRQRHAEWLRAQRHVHLDAQNRLFVHAGWDPDYEWDNPGQQHMQEYLWNRSFWEGMLEGQDLAPQFHEVFIGHSPTIRTPPNKALPMQVRNVWNLDSGAGFAQGALSLMDLDTKQVWTSTPPAILYPTYRGR